MQDFQDVMSPNERIGKLLLLFLDHPKGLSFSDVRSYMTEAYRGDDEAVRKKFQRDRDALKQFGMHIELDQSGAAANTADKVYVIAETSRTIMGDLILTDSERAYLMALIVRYLNRHDQKSKEHAVARSLYLKLFYQDTDRIKPTEIDEPNEPLFTHSTATTPAALQPLQEAMMNRRKIKIRYESNNTNKERVIQPLALNMYRRVWYVTAFCELAQDYRIFQLNQISEWNILNQPIDSHLPEIIKFLKPHPLNLRREQLTAIQLKLNSDYINRFDHFIRELPPNQRVKSGQDRRDIVTGNPEALFFWMLRNQRAVLAISPESIRDRFIAFLDSIKKIYEDAQ